MEITKMTKNNTSFPTIPLLTSGCYPEVTKTNKSMTETNNSQSSS